MSSSELKENDVTKLTFGLLSALALPVDRTTGQNYINGSGQIILQSNNTLNLGSKTLITPIPVLGTTVAQMPDLQGTVITLSKYPSVHPFNSFLWPDIVGAISARFKVKIYGSVAIGDGIEANRIMNSTISVKVGDVTALFKGNQMISMPFVNVPAANVGYASGFSLEMDFLIDFGANIVSPGDKVDVVFHAGTVKNAGYDSVDLVPSSSILLTTGAAVVLPTQQEWSVRVEVNPIFP